MERLDRRRAVRSGALAAGYLALSCAVLAAHGAPAAGYELSIYTATPLAVWVGVGIALAVALPTAITTADRHARWTAVALATLSVVAVSALPILRGYYFYGFGDSLTHLGWARDIAAGELGAFGLFYPGLHTASILFSRVLGVPLPTAMLLVVLCFLLVYLLFVPLCVRELTGRSGGVVVGSFAALLVLPVNHIAFSYMDPHPISEAILFSPLLLYLLLRYVDGTTGPARRLGIAGRSRTLSLVGGLFALSLVAILVYHTMQAANLLSILLGVCVLQAVVRWRATDPERTVGRRTLYAHTVFFVAAFALWNLQFSVVTATAQAVFDSLLSMVTGSASAGAVVSSRSSSLSGLGASLEEIFLKLFLPSAVFALLTAGLVFYSVYRWRRRSLTGVRVLGAGMVGLSLYSLPFIAGNVSKLLFRNLGFLMTLGTVLGAAAVLWLVAPERPLSAVGPARQTCLTLLFAALLVGSLVIVFPSPYIYNANGGVAETEYRGYETAFEYHEPNVTFAGIRSGPQRLIQAVYGRHGIPPDLTNFGYYRAEGAIRGENLTRLRAVVSEPRYLVVTEKSRLRELEAYDGLRYTREQFDAVDAQAGVARVLSNGPFTLYRITPYAT